MPRIGRAVAERRPEDGANPTQRRVSMRDPAHAGTSTVHAVMCLRPGAVRRASIRSCWGKFLRDVAKLNQGSDAIFRIFGPDETLSESSGALFLKSPTRQ